jgi:voltage-gated potassium channel
VITVSTVGFGEIKELSDSSRIFTIILILLGVSAFTYTFRALGEGIVAGEFRGLVRARRMRKSITALKGHNIICGYGRTGRHIAEELKLEGQDIVIVESDPDALGSAQADQWLTVDGDAGHDEVLIEANIEAATRLIATTGSDATNLMISLSARLLNPRLFIVSRADDDANEQKLLKAGASRVVSTYRSAGRRMAQLALRPNAVEVADIMLGDEKVSLSIEDLPVGSRSKLDGKTLEDCISPEGANYMIIAVRRRGVDLELMPPLSTKVTSGDVLIAFGTRDQLRELESFTVAPAT